MLILSTLLDIRGLRTGTKLLYITCFSILHIEQPLFTDLRYFDSCRELKLFAFEVIESRIFKSSKIDHLLAIPSVTGRGG